MGNKEEKFVLEWLHILNRFIQQISAVDYLWNSEELTAFLRPTMDVEKSLILMSKLNTEQTLDRIMTHLQVDEQGAGERLSKYNEQIWEFKAHAKEAFKLLDQLKKYMGGLAQIRSH